MAKLKRGRNSDASDAGSEEQESDVPKAKKAKNLKVSKQPSPASIGQNGKGESYWDLSSSARRVTVTKFGFGKSKDAVRVDIREFYEKDGEQLPGKKGISLSVEQFGALLKLVPSITAALAKEGESIEIYTANSNENVRANIETAPKRLKPKPGRSNIEATSDEDEE